MSEHDAVKNVMELGRAALDVAEERDRLRAALEQIVALTPHGSSCPEHFTLLPGIFYIARTALASKPTVTEEGG